MSIPRLTWRLAHRGIVLWSTLNVVVVISGAAAYRAAYPTAAARAALATSLTDSPGLDALYGRAVHLDTLDGFTVWRYGTVLQVVTALWAVLAVTRVLRGDEEAGRFEVVAAGPSTPRRVLTGQVAVLMGGVVIVGAATAVAATVGGLSAGVAAWFGLSIVVAAGCFGGFAALTSQLWDGRRRAAGAAGAALGASYLLRAIGDGSSSARWVGRLSPLGWAGRLDPAGSDHSMFALGGLVALTALCLAAAVTLRSRRDLQRGVLRTSRGGPKQRRVHSLLRLELLSNRVGFVGWGLGAVLLGWVLGFIAGDVGSLFEGDDELARRLGELGGGSIATIRGFMGFGFAALAVVTALYAGAQLVTARAEESATRLEPLLTAGASRTRCLLTRLAVGVVAVTGVTLLAGLAGWLGVYLSGHRFGIGDAMAGAANTLPVALLFLGLATVTFGAAPRATAGVAYGSVAVAYALLLVTALTDSLHWLGNVSPFQHLAPVPAVAASAAPSAILAGLGVLGVVVGAVAFDRRDLTGG